MKDCEHLRSYPYEDLEGYLMICEESTAVEHILLKLPLKLRGAIITDPELEALSIIRRILNLPEKLKVVLMVLSAEVACPAIEPILTDGTDFNHTYIMGQESMLSSVYNK